ncbi:hypothetical protein BKA66DRAFT_319733 [Pyrenochaeta sp. MPI-SDFR-AT-0127]|nr:hypothetical protein BKA66DRAFT_319733 [Pyrenochaeta sp. MPI-SDFR-AT-0127]
MCIVLPIRHISCTHTIFIWQHCVDATRFGMDGQTPCCNVQQNGQTILTRKVCENCGGERYFVRRGGIAERGNGSSSSTLEDRGTYDQEDAHDSGYNSDVINEEDKEEGSELEDVPVSPKGATTRRLRTKQQVERKARSSSHSRPRTRRPSWKPNLKRELAFEDTQKTTDRRRRDSIDSLISNFDGNIWHASREPQAIVEEKVDVTAPVKDPRGTTQKSAVRKHHPSKRRLSTLLHPSSPSHEITVGVQTARAFAFPQLVDVQQSSDGSKTRTPTRKRSSLMHPSTPAEGFSFPPRKGSPPLHSLGPMANLSSCAHHRTVISVPPMQQDGPERKIPTLIEISPSPSSLRQLSSIPARRLPTLVTDTSAAVFSTGSTAKQVPSRPRRESVLHSCLSDSEDDTSDGYSSFPHLNSKRTRNTHHARYANSTDTEAIKFSSSSSDIDSEDAEDALLANTARAARASRQQRVRNG